MKAAEHDLGVLIVRSHVASRVRLLAHVCIRAYMCTQDAPDALIS